MRNTTRSFIGWLVLLLLTHYFFAGANTIGQEKRQSTHESDVQEFVDAIEGYSVKSKQSLKAYLMGQDSDNEYFYWNELNMLSSKKELHEPMFQVMRNISADESFPERLRNYAEGRLILVYLIATPELAELQEQSLRELVKQDDADPLSARIEAAIEERHFTDKTKAELANLKIVLKIDSDALHAKDQTEEQRKLSLQKTIQAAIENLKSGNDVAFVQTQMDPYALAEIAIFSEMELNDVAIGICTRARVESSKDGEGYDLWKFILEELGKQVDADPKWELDGRIATFPEQKCKSHWIFRDHSWYYVSYDGSSGGGPEIETVEPVDFFTTTEKFEWVDFAKLNTQEKIVESWKKSAEHVISQIEAEDYRGVVALHCCPFSFAAQAFRHSPPRSIDELAAIFSSNPRNFLQNHVIPELKSHLAAEPRLLLDGRVIAGEPKDKSGQFIYWTFSEGRWRMVFALR
jgi:hypothetical protein